MRVGGQWGDSAAQDPSGAMAWHLCQCGMSYWCKNDATWHSTKSRCIKNHIEAEQLKLVDQPLTIENVIWVILSHSMNHHTHNRIKQALKREKIEAKVVYGYRLGQDQHMGEVLKPNEVVHYSFQHKILPAVYKKIKESRDKGMEPAGVAVFEGDAMMHVTAKSLVTWADSVNKPIAWAGYARKGANGSTCIVYKQDALEVILHHLLERRGTCTGICG